MNGHGHTHDGHEHGAGPGHEHRLGLWARLGNAPFVLLIRVYRVTLSPFIGGQCRYEPTCSRYGLDAYRLYGPIRGTRMTLGRVLRCHPFTKGGYDPVPIPDDVRPKAGEGTGVSVYAPSAGTGATGDQTAWDRKEQAGR